MDILKLNLDNWKINRTFLKFKAEANLSFNQYLTLIELYSVEQKGDCVTYKQLREKLGISDKSDFNKIVMGPLNKKSLTYGEQRKAPEEKDAFITERGSELVEKVLGLKTQSN